MTKIGIIVPTGEKAEVEIVRFFEAYGKKYLVYTLNEKDEQGFVKLYVARIDEAPDATGTQKVLSGSFIDDENEWKLVKDEFKKIIGENSDSGSTSANDLNPADLLNINVRGNRVIKLMESYVNLLSANQKQFTAAPTHSAPAMDFGYQSMPSANSYSAPNTNFDYQAPNSYEAPVQHQAFPGVAPMPESRVQSAPTMDFGYQAPKMNNDYGQPVNPFPSMPDFPAQAQQQPVAPAAANNYEAMYNELKERFDRCNAELEKVTNENIELRIKIDDIREILNEN